MNVQNLKIKAKRYAPELLMSVGLLGCSVVSLVVANKISNKVDPFTIKIQPEQADSILVLEQVGVDIYRDLDFPNESYRVTPIR